MEEVNKRAVELGFKQLSLSVRIELKEQQEYYSRMGYTISELKSNKGFKEPTCVVMRKKIFD
jgi:hypothetical protein